MDWKIPKKPNYKSFCAKIIVFQRYDEQKIKTNLKLDEIVFNNSLMPIDNKSYSLLKNEVGLKRIKIIYFVSLKYFMKYCTKNFAE